MSETETLGLPLTESGGADNKIIDSALETIRQHLGMPIAYLSEIVGGKSVFRNVSAPGFEHLIKPGDSRNLDEVYCQHILEGRLPQLIPNTANEPLAAAMPITAAVPIGSHVSLPIRLANGETFGMFCCLSPEPNATLNHRDLATMQMFADLVSKQVNLGFEARREARSKQARIKDALSSRAFSMVYQPIVDLGDMRPRGFESLCRFPVLPALTPDVWFREAGEVGLGVELELAAIEAAMGARHDLTCEQYLSINASPATVLDPKFSALMSTLALDWLVLEITEHAVVQDYETLCRVLSKLRARGLRLAVDDAGAGHSSLRHIIQLEADYIKLDMSLTRNVDSDLARQALVSALVFYTRETGAQIIAEGIETEAELQTLKLLGVRRGQGYLLGRPTASAIRDQAPGGELEKRARNGAA